MKIRIGTRGSALALWQANHTKARLEATRPGTEVELHIIKTKGDKILDVALAKVGGKGLFVTELEEALARGDVDLAVHSMKDVPAQLHVGLELVAVSAREDAADALCVRSGGQSPLVGQSPPSLPVGKLVVLPQGARVGTSSLRRRCQLLAARPDLQIELLRGNVDTRLRKLDEGGYDAIVLAAAGLVRLGLAARITERLPFELSLPAVGQGVLGFEARADDAETIALVREALHDADGADAASAERAFLARIGGGCQTPLAAHARVDGADLALVARVGTPDGKTILEDRRRGHRATAAALGAAAAEALLAQGADAILAALEGA